MTTNTGTAVPSKQEEKKHHGFWFDLLRRLIREKPLGTFGLVIVIILFIVGIFANLLAPYGMNEVHLIDRLKPPSSTYLLGTDQLGRDLLSRLIYGARDFHDYRSRRYGVVRGLSHYHWGCFRICRR